MLDLVIKGGSVVDGTGAPARQANVGVRDGRIVALGDVDEPARRTIDADGLVVAPGFVDPHTHYDAQLLWDGAATPSCFHGVTTVIGGNCGFSLAPLDPADADYLRRMMARVEGMPLPALEQGLAWDWRGFDDYLARLDSGIGVNAGFLVGHSALRRAVLHDEANERPATDAEIDAMRALLAAGLHAGGLGFSSSHNNGHTDGDAKPVPSRAADHRELLALAGVVREHPGTTLEYITAGCLTQLSPDEIALMTDLSATAQRPLNWNVLSFDPRRPEVVEHQLGAGDHARAHGGEVVALTMPFGGTLRLSFRTYCALFLLPGWGDVLEQPEPQRLVSLADPDTRRRLLEQAQRAEGPLRNVARFDRYRIGQTVAPANERYRDRLVGDIAADERRDPFDVLLDIVVADDLRTHLWPEAREADAGLWDQRAALLRDDRALLGGSDAGAHLDRMCGARYPTELLAEGVRRFGALRLEEAIRMLTDQPARLFGLRDRGRIAEGMHADLVAFDPTTVAPLPIREVQDLPGGSERLTSDATGVAHVLVNGVEILRDGELTHATSGVVLRSGRDTDTVSPAAR
jgi:N-acyl-D-aspartate/D-glutamate deacylase